MNKKAQSLSPHETLMRILWILLGLMAAVIIIFLVSKNLPKLLASIF